MNTNYSIKKGSLLSALIFAGLLFSNTGKAQVKVNGEESKTPPVPVKVPEVKKSAAPVLRLKPLDSVEAGIIAKELLDTTILVGTFEAPGVLTAPRRLKNGIMPELENTYLEAVLGHTLMKLNTFRTFRGNFDSMIYLKMPTMNTDEEEPMQFFPFPDTRWLLLLKPVYDADGTPTENWVRDIEKANAQKYINSTTLFKVNNEYHGNLILKWNNEYQTAYNAYTIAPGAMPEMEKLLNLLEKARQAKWHSEAPAALSSEKWQDESVRKLAVRLDQLLNLKAPKEIEEPVTPGQ